MPARKTANVAHIFEQFVGSLSTLIKEKVSESVNIATTEFFNSKLAVGAAKVAKVGKRRGRKPGRKPGRPAKADKAAVKRGPGRPPKRGPGRPPKNPTAAPKRRGRPPKAKVEAPVVETVTE